MNALLDELRAELAEREARDLSRRLDVGLSVGAVDLVTNDYLGLSRHPAVVDGVRRRLADGGAGSNSGHGDDHLSDLREAVRQRRVEIHAFLQPALSIDRHESLAG